MAAISQSPAFEPFFLSCQVSEPRLGTSSLVRAKPCSRGVRRTSRILYRRSHRIIR